MGKKEKTAFRAWKEEGKKGRKKRGAVILPNMEFICFRMNRKEQGERMGKSNKMDFSARKKSVKKGQKKKFEVPNIVLTLCVVALLVVGVFLAGYIAGRRQTENVPQQQSRPQSHYPLTIVDDMGRTVNIEKKPVRIVSLAPSNTEVLFSLGLGDMVVGVTDFCDYPPEAQQKEKVGGFAPPNVEKILSLTPDLVVAYYGQETTVEQLENAGLLVIVMHPQTVYDVFQEIKLLGLVTDRSVQAETLVTSLLERLNNITAVTSMMNESVRPRVYYEMWCGPFYTAGPGSFVDDIIRKAGGMNIASGTASEWPIISEEFIISSNPQVIITTFMNMATPDDIKSRTGWDVLDAVKNNRVYQLDGNLLERPGPRLIDGVEMLYDLFKQVHLDELSELYETYIQMEEIAPQQTTVL